MDVFNKPFQMDCKTSWRIKPMSKESLCCKCNEPPKGSSQAAFSDWSRWFLVFSLIGCIRPSSSSGDWWSEIGWCSQAVQKRAGVRGVACVFHHPATAHIWTHIYELGQFHFTRFHVLHIKCAPPSTWCAKLLLETDEKYIYSFIYIPRKCCYLFLGILISVTSPKRGPGERL